MRGDLSMLKYEDIKKIAILFDKKAVVFDITQDELNTLQQAFPDARICLKKNQDDLILEMPDADAIFVFPGITADRYIKQDKNLKWVHSLIAGVDFIAIPEVIDNDDIVLTNTSGIHGKPISEYVVAMILGKLKSLSYMEKQQKKHIWMQPWLEEIEGKTVAVLGVGNIGKEIARKCKVLGFRVLGYKRSFEELDYVDQIFTDPSELPGLLSQSDFVVSTMPASPQTNKMIGRAQFEQMKKGAYFINVGRGATVDTYALIWALQNGQISGCSLDAVDPEPLPGDSPLWDLQNCIITPHTSASSPLYTKRAFEKIAVIAADLKNGRSITNLVDKSQYK